MADNDEDETTEVADPELRQLLGMFDVPAFARRGQDLEYALNCLHARLRREREAMLEMVRLRLRQWALGVEGPDAWPGTFTEPIETLWAAAGVNDPPEWGKALVSARRRRTLARDLSTSVERFNRRWAALIDGIDLRPLNRMIEHYNRYYLLEKECVFRSSRLAARNFSPHPSVSADDLRADYPILPAPGLAR